MNSDRLRNVAIVGAVLACGMLAASPNRVRAQDTSKARTDAPDAAENPLRALQGLFDRLTRPSPPPDAEPMPDRGPGAATPLPRPASQGAPAAPAAPPATTNPASTLNPSLQSSPSLGAASAPPAPAPSAALMPAKESVVLLLPTKSALLGLAAETTRQGFVAAQGASEQNVNVTLLETDGSAEDALTLYKTAVASGATVVVGPMARAEVTGLAKSGAVSIPTLALNAPEADVKLPNALMVFGLAIEQEAREVARLAAADGAKRAVVVTLNSPLTKRASQAFSESWRKSGGEIVEELEVAAQPSGYGKLRGQISKLEADVVFLSADAERARLIRPQLGKRNIVATSQVFAGVKPVRKSSGTPGASGAAGRLEAETGAFHDLNGIRFVDMPWLHQPDHAAAVLYPRSEKALTSDLERLYALGIDAYRLALVLVRRNEARAAALVNNTAFPVTELSLDGVTGKLTVRDGNVERAPIRAAFRDGQAVSD